MNPDTLKALKDSIAHWERIVAGEESSDGGDNCALCQRFGLVCRVDGEKCPVFQQTGIYQCTDTPYYEFRVASREEGSANSWSNKVNGPKSLAFAKAELAFLQSLLPEENPDEQV